MKAFIRGTLAASALALTAAANADITVPSGKYTLEKTHGYITFTYSHLGFSNPQIGFDSFDVDLDLDAANPAASSLSVTVDATSVNSRVEVFDEHLNDDKLFNTDEFPSISFTSTGMEALGDDQFKVMGDLTIKGITKPVVLDASINKTGNNPFSKKPTVGVSATAKVMRSEWDMSYATPAVGDEVTISIEVELHGNPDS
ncbi:MAG: YceI family protein [Pseudomonadota bacterium]